MFNQIKYSTRHNSLIFGFITLFISGGLFIIYEAVFLLSFLNTLFLSSLPIVAFLFYYKNKNFFLHIYSNRKKGDFKYFLLFVFAGSLIFLFINSIFLLRYYYFYADDWGLYNRFFESSNIWTSISTRYNDHPSFLLNGILAFNLFQLGGQTFIPILLNISALFSISIIFFNVIYKSVRTSLTILPTLALSLSLMVFTYWMSDGVAAFWSIGFLPVLGAITASYGLVHLSKWSYHKGVLIYFLGSIVISLCTGFGAAIWWIFFFSAVLKKLSKSSKIFSFFISLLGSILTLGIYAFSHNNLLSPNIIPLFLALPAFLGAPIMVGFHAIFPEEQLIIPSIIIGFVGLIFFSYFLYNFYKGNSEDNEKYRGKLFFILLCIFVGGCSFLIAYGRMENDLLVITRGQYFLWSSIFWFSIVGLSMIHITENIVLKKIVNLPFYFSLLLMLLILLFNGLRIDHRLSYYSSNVKGIIDLM